MLKISVKSDIERALARLNALERQVVPTAAARALNKTAAQARTEAARLIKARYQIPTRAITRAIRLA
ncbi:MAG: phage tail protein, partial [Candidatus Acidiferrales bacterium]